jgi:hypothetical protein
MTIVQNVRPDFPLLLMLFALLTGCIPLEDPRPFSPGDLRPPCYAGMHQSPDGLIHLTFDERVSTSREKVCITDSEGDLILLTDITHADALVTLHPERMPGAGEQCTIIIQVADKSGNTLDLLIPFYGINPDLPPVVIHEFTTNNSASSPEMVELLVLEAGNLAGALVCQGIDGDAVSEVILPPIEAEAGDFVIVHFRPEGIPEEIDEVTDKSASGGKKAHPEAWDIWVPGGKGISTNNGVLTLYNRPGGAMLDGVLYSNRTSSSDTNYRGFGSSATLRRAEALVAAEMWITSEGPVRPEDAVNPDPGTATRSLFRMPDAADTNSADDWFVAPTSGATFGWENGTAVYQQ